MDALEFIRVRELEVAVRIWNPTAPAPLSLGMALLATAATSAHWRAS